MSLFDSIMTSGCLGEARQFVGLALGSPERSTSVMYQEAVSLPGHTDDSIIIKSWITRARYPSCENRVAIAEPACAHVLRCLMDGHGEPAQGWRSWRG